MKTICKKMVVKCSLGTNGLKKVKEFDYDNFGRIIISLSKVYFDHTYDNGA
jgi:hypothetical protein